MIKYACICSGFILVSCARVDTNPEASFVHVKRHVEHLTGQQIYWNDQLQDVITMTSIEEVLDKRLTREDVVQIALLNNQNLQALYEDLGIAKAQLAQAGLLRNPIFSFSYRFSTKSSVTDLIDMSLIQNFLEIALIPLKKRLAQAELEATQAMITTRILDVIAETQIAFCRLQAAENIWKLKKQQLLAAELSYEAAQKLYAVKNLIQLKLTMEKSQYEQMKLEVATAEIDVLNSRETLNVLMGLWGNQIAWKIDDQLSDLPSEEENFSAIENEAIANSLDLKMAYQNLLATASLFGIDTSRLILPQFNLGASSERDDSVWYVGPALDLALPIFDFGTANSAKAKSAITQKWAEYTALAIEIRSQARSTRFIFLNAYRQSQYLTKIIVPLAKKITHLTLLQHNAMQMGVFRLLAAKSREIEQEIRAIELKRDYWLAKTQLDVLLNGHVFDKTTFQTPLRRHFE